MVGMAQHQKLVHLKSSNECSMQIKWMHNERCQAQHSNWTVASCTDSLARELLFRCLICMNIQRTNDVALAYLNLALV